MVVTKKEIYAKAYVELYEIIRNLSAEEQSKIPSFFKDSLLQEMDKEYKFCIDSDNSILEQNYMNETKALFIKVYEKYLSEDSDFWTKYNKICSKMIDDNKKTKMNYNDIFESEKKGEKTEINSQDVIIIDEKINFFKRIILKIKSIFMK